MGNAPSGKKAVTASAKATRKAAPVKSATTAATAAPATPTPTPTLTPTASVSDKAKRQKKEKVVRDSFTMPKREYETIAKLKQKCLDAGIAVKKSELLRAGLLLLDALPAKRLAAAVAHVETVKTGRPSTN